jgi:hypothetical protein
MFLVLEPSPASKTVHEDDRPLLLVVCDDLERLSSVRHLIRTAGPMPATARSVEAATSLLTQVRVDGCLICTRVSPTGADRLWDALESSRPGCVKLYVTEYQTEKLTGWTPCAEDELASTVSRAFVR